CLSARPGNSGCRWGATRPSGSLADWRPGYPRLDATSRRPMLVFASHWGPRPGRSGQTVGAPAAPRDGRELNMAERVSRLIRFTRSLAGSGVALTGGDTVPGSERNLR